MQANQEHDPEFIRYSARLAVPNHMDFLESWTLRSRLFRQKAFVQRVSYGASAREGFDYFPCAHPCSAPTLVFYHGGYWQALQSSDFSFIADAYTMAGVNVIIVDYDLCPRVSMIKIQEQILSSFLAIVAASERLGFDPGRLVLSGHSAGGQMVASILCEDWQSFGLAADSFSIMHVISMSGIFDLRPLVRTPINQALSMSDEVAWYLSPIRRAPQMDVPLFLIVGADETEGFLQQGDWLRERWQESLSSISSVCIKGQHHFSVVDAFADRSHSLFQKLCHEMLQV